MNHRFVTALDTLLRLARKARSPDIDCTDADRRRYEEAEAAYEDEYEAFIKRYGFSPR